MLGMLYVMSCTSRFLKVSHCIHDIGVVYVTLQW